MRSHSHRWLLLPPSHEPRSIPGRVSGLTEVRPLSLAPRHPVGTTVRESDGPRTAAAVGPLLAQPSKLFCDRQFYFLFLTSLTRPPACSRTCSQQDVERQMAIEDRGFASMNPAKRRKIARLGGKAAHQKGVAHVWTKKEARDAGRKGGIARRARLVAAKAAAVDAEEVAESAS